MIRGLLLSPILTVAGCGLIVGDYGVNASTEDSDAEAGGQANDSSAPHDSEGGAQSADSTTTSESSATPGQCQLQQFYSSACTPCANASCCAQQQQCAQDSDCNAYALCILGCYRQDGCTTSKDCQTTCTMTYQVGYDRFNGYGGMQPNVDNCVLSACGQACEQSCPP